MKFWTPVFLLNLLSTTAWADMIEIKGRGVLNGAVLSQDEKETRFQDTNGNLYVVPKADVLFLEVQKDVLPQQTAAGKGFDWKSVARGWVRQAQSLWKKIGSRFGRPSPRKGDARPAPQHSNTKTAIEPAQSYDIREDWSVTRERETSHRYNVAPSAPGRDNSGRIIRTPKYKVDKDTSFSLGD